MILLLLNSVAFLAMQSRLALRLPLSLCRL
jgi:hypothetical protein